MNWSLIVGNGKTFTGAALLIASAAASALGWLPPQLHLDVSPLTAASAALMAVGIGSKLQAVIAIFQKP